MVHITTYVFIDLETSGLPHQEHNKTKIAEMSMVAVCRQHLLATRPGASPRVQDKLTLCFNPGRMIHPDSSLTTGLDNELLEYKSSFNIDVCNMVNTFLKILPQPVCLIAQNGMGFDFPIIKNHFDKLNMSLSDDVLCADCYHGFYDILEEKKLEEEQLRSLTIVAKGAATVNQPNELKEVKGESGELKETVTVELKEIKELKETGSVRDESELKESKPEIECSGTQQNVTKTEHCEDLTDMIEFTNDVSVKEISDKDTVTMQSLNETTPERQVRTLPTRPQKRNGRIEKARRRFPFSIKPKESYKLKDIYQRVLNRPALEAHRAENDCIYALEIAVAIGEKFVAWVDENCCPFTDIKAMKLGTPLGLLVLTGVLWGCTNPFIRQGTKGLRSVQAKSRLGQVYAEIAFLLGNWRYVVPWLANQAGSLSYLAAVQRAPLSVAVPAANGLAFAFTAIVGAAVGAEEPLDRGSIFGVFLIVAGTALCCLDKT